MRAHLLRRHRPKQLHGILEGVYIDHLPQLRFHRSGSDHIQVKRAAVLPETPCGRKHIIRVLQVQKAAGPKNLRRILLTRKRVRFGIDPRLRKVSPPVGPVTEQAEFRIIARCERTCGQEIDRPARRVFAMPANIARQILQRFRSLLQRPLRIPEDQLSPALSLPEITLLRGPENDHIRVCHPCACFLCVPRLVFCVHIGRLFFPAIPQLAALLTHRRCFDECKIILNGIIQCVGKRALMMVEVIRDKSYLHMAPCSLYSASAPAAPPRIIKNAKKK